MVSRTHDGEQRGWPQYSGHRDWPKHALTPTTLWTLEEQTEGKHLLLRSYLDGWFPILGSFSGRLLFIDGFAGPGEYSNGETGSPLVAIESVRRHRSAGRLRQVEVVFLFIEKDERRVAHLETLLDDQSAIPKTNVHVHRGTFDDYMTSLLDQLDNQSTALAPAFVMIDPFGVIGSPMQLIGRILRNPKSESLISFMYEPIRRFHRQSEFEGHLNELFGTKEWQDGFDIKEEAERKPFFHKLFTQQLKKQGAKYVVTFELYRAHAISTRCTSRPALQGVRPHEVPHLEARPRRNLLLPKLRGWSAYALWGGYRPPSSPTTGRVQDRVDIDRAGGGVRHG